MKDPKPIDDDTKPARRALLGAGSAAALSTVLGGVAVALAACGDDDDAPPAAMSGGHGGSGGSAGTSAAPSGAGGAAGSKAVDADIEPLNALLKAEYTAITAYSAGAGLIGQATSKDPLFSAKGVITSIAVDFQSQHKLHAQALVDAVQGLGGVPVLESDVAASFSPPDGLVANPTIGNVLKFAASAERAAAVAYNQVLSGLENAKFRFLASAIEGDEAQHFIVLAALVLGLAAPTSKLTSDTANEVVPEAFTTTVDNYDGLDKAPPDYFA